MIAMRKSIAWQEMRTVGGIEIRICGKMVNKFLARIVYRCEECLGELELWNAGIVCKASHTHRGFIHQSEADKIIAKNQANIELVTETYAIKNGQIVFKGDDNGN